MGGFKKGTKMFIWSDYVLAAAFIIIAFFFWEHFKIVAPKDDDQDDEKLATVKRYMSRFHRKTDSDAEKLVYQEILEEELQDMPPLQKRSK